MIKTIDTDAVMGEIRHRQKIILLKARQNVYLASLIAEFGLIRIEDVEEIITSATPPDCI